MSSTLLQSSFPTPPCQSSMTLIQTRPRQTREKVFSEAAQTGFWIGAAHISFPGLGHVGIRAKGFVWIPAEYTTRLSKAAGN
jgi:hypothetical protein